MALFGALGAGYATRITYDSLSDGLSKFGLDDNSAFAWQGKLGLRYGLGEHYSWVLDYRYLALDSVGLSDDFQGSTFAFEKDSSAVEVGVRWTF